MINTGRSINKNRTDKHSEIKKKKHIQQCVLQKQNVVSEKKSLKNNPFSPHLYSDHTHFNIISRFKMTREDGNILEGT